MKKIMRILYFLPVALLACNQPIVEQTKPAVAFASFINLETNVVIPGTTDALPAKFIANVRSSDRKKVTAVQCFNGNTVTPDTATPRYVAACVYEGVSGNSVTIKAEATNLDSLKSEAQKTVTIDSIFPKASTLKVGTNDLDPNSGTQFSMTAALDSTLLFKLTSTDTDVLSTFIDKDGQTLVTSPNGAVQIEYKVQDLSPFTVGLNVVDKAGNITRYTVLVAPTKIVGDGAPPLVNIASPNNVTPATEVNGTLNVAVNASDTSGIQEVVLIANNNPVATTKPDNTSPTVSFSLDTLKFDNGPLELKAFAVDKSGLSATSGAVNVVIKNIQAPILQINSPGNAATVNGFVDVSLNVRKRASDFTYQSDILVQLIDYRGDIAETKTIVVNGQPGTTNSFITPTSFDLSARPNDIYTIKATATVAVIGDTLPTRVITNSIDIRNLNQSEQPPAIIIQNPVRINETQTILPVFRQPFGFVVAEVSDNSGLASVELRATCTSCANGAGPVNALEQYVKLNDVSFAQVALRFDAGGTPFLPNGDYTMRVVAEDSNGNRNIQEVKVKIQRDPAYVKLSYFREEGEATSDFKPGSGSCTVTGLATGKQYRAASWFISPSGVYSFREDYVSGQSSVGIRSTFNAVGNWRCFTQVTNITDGLIDWVEDGFNVVKP
jgi:Bacterial Ig domain